MKSRRSILDRLNDVEATIAQVARDAGESPSLAVRLSLQSLQSRRDMMREELVEISQQSFVDVSCRWR